MNRIPFSGMMCSPENIQKEGDFKIVGKVGAIMRAEYFPSKDERDRRFELVTKLLKEER